MALMLSLVSRCGWVHLHSRHSRRGGYAVRAEGKGSDGDERVSSSKRNNRGLEIVKKRVVSTGVPSVAMAPVVSLERGNWVKLICGASFEDVVDIRNLSLVYTLAGVDCIDCAADASVVSAVNEGIAAALNIVPLRRPWVMISVNDDQDLHFRKAAFDPSDCPLDCSRPCEAVCPANAIAFNQPHSSLQGLGGVIQERCYGCGRCLPVCPYDNIRSSYPRITSIGKEGNEDKRNSFYNRKVEPLQKCRQTTSFEELWNGIRDSVSHLRLVAISLPDVGESATTLMSTMIAIMRPNLSCYNLWQLDGRPMSGDIGRGATREALAFAVRLAAAEDRPPGFLQLAGGTNAHTANGLKELGLFQTNREYVDGFLFKEKSGSCNSLIGGIAYGGYARKIVGRILRSMQSQHGLAYIEDHPSYLCEALGEALALVGSVKCDLNLGINQH